MNVWLVRECFLFEFFLIHIATGSGAAIRVRLLTGRAIRLPCIFVLAAVELNRSIMNLKLLLIFPIPSKTDS